MGVLLNKYPIKNFNQVPHLQDALQTAENKKVRDSLKIMLEIFKRHGVHRDFGLMIVHRHFELNPNEILVEGLNTRKNLSVAVPWKLTGTFATPVEQEFYKRFDLEEQHILIPQSWSFSEKGTIEPFEFMQSDKELANPPTEFVMELYDALKNFNLQNVLGLRRIHLVWESATWETTPDSVRANITQIGERPQDIEKEDMVPVVWKATEDNEESQGFCALCWCGSCGNCYGTRSLRQKHGK